MKTSETTPTLAINHYLNKVAPPGSDLYYATRSLNADKQRALLSLYAYENELQSIPITCTDPGVARMKLQWWKSETNNLFAGNAEHPITKALIPLVQQYQLEKSNFEELHAGISARITGFQWQNSEEQIQYCYQLQGAITELASKILGITDLISLEAIRNIGIGLGFTQLITQLRDDIKNDRYTLAATDMQQHEVTLENLWPLTSTDSIRNVLQTTFQRAEEFFERGLSVLKKTNKRETKPLRIIATLHRALLLEIKKDNFSVLEHKLELTPIRKYLLTWFA